MLEYQKENRLRDKGNVIKMIEDGRKNTARHDKVDTHAYVVWKCEDEESPNRPRRKGDKCGCGKWHIMRTRRRNGRRDNPWIGKCRDPNCGKRSRLNAGKVHIYFNEGDAKRDRYFRNKED